jgi:hypothetical protein
MSGDGDGFGFALPPFKPDEALAGLRRTLRELGLTEREGRFERAGTAIARLAIDGGTIAASVVRKPSRNSPEWTTRALKSGADVRDFAADLKRKLAGWSDRDD